MDLITPAQRDELFHSFDKDNQPKWEPATLEAVSDADIDAYFAPLPDELDLAGIDHM